MSVLVVAAHPDDEVLGCGGTIAKLVSQGAKVDLLFIADGVTARPSADPAVEIAARSDMARKAAGILGVEEPSFLALPDNRLDSIALLDITQAIETKIDELKPNIIFSHHPGDLNIDHEIVSRAVLTACRPVPDSSIRKIYAFGVASSTGWHGPYADKAFAPNVFSDITDTLNVKIQALRCYEAEMRAFPHMRSLEAIEAEARATGALVGLGAAEAFQLVRGFEVS